MHREQQPAAGGALSTTVTYRFERPQEDLRLFKFRVIVAGSRSFNDYSLFTVGMRNYVERHFSDMSKVVFITGFAKSGPDAMIVRWCEEHGYPWVRFEAQWDDLEAPGAVARFRRDGTAYNVRAGYDRNGLMARRGTNLIAWWDGLSGGTRDMVAQADKHKLTYETVLVDTPPRNSDNGWQPQGRRSGSDRGDGKAAAWQP